MRNKFTKGEAIFLHLSDLNPRLAMNINLPEFIRLKNKEERLLNNLKKKGLIKTEVIKLGS